MTTHFSRCSRLPGLVCLASIALAGALPLVAAEDWSRTNSMASIVHQYEADRQAVSRFYELPWSVERENRLEKLFAEWRVKLGEIPFESLAHDDHIDYLLLRNELSAELARLRMQKGRRTEMEPAIPFARSIHSLELARWRMEPIDARKAAETVAKIPDSIRALRKKLKADKEEKNDPKKKTEATPETDPENIGAADRLHLSPTLALRTASAVSELRSTFKGWNSYYEGVVPEFSWWMKTPSEAVLTSMEDYARFLREEIAGIKGKDEDPLIGDPIGAEALADDLASEYLAYSAEELLRIGEAEFAWCEAEMKKASAELGLGDNWKAALEKVKAAHVPPGDQDQVVAAEARFAIEFIKSRDLVTIPPLCEELWRTSMLSTDSQKSLPYAAYNNPNMLVAYAREDMKHDDKLMAMRGNNRHFTRIVTPHELIPGHHLEAFMTSRFQGHRRIFRTPFFVEGWALYWEMKFWNLGYGRTPEERIGMLFWRMHRCARIVVSLKFHLGQMSPPQMVAYLVERVGHEKLGATSEVRRFIGGAYSPLYQCAYMIGGLQLQALHNELVEGGRMSEKAFNDSVLRQGAIPVELIRLTLSRVPVSSDSKPAWRPLVR